MCFETRIWHISVYILLLLIDISNLIPATQILNLTTDFGNCFFFFFFFFFFFGGGGGGVVISKIKCQYSINSMYHNLFIL